MKTILGVDVGFGAIKSTLQYEDGTIIKQFKFPSRIGITKKNEHVADNRIYDYKDYSYYVGENANHVPTADIIDIQDYDKLEYYSPLFLYHVIKQLGVTPDIIVTGLSIAQINNSGHFQAAIKNFEVQGETFNFENVYVLPQGAGSKLTIDKYGNHFPKEQDEFLGKSTYIGVDIGMNTLDMFKVSDGKTSPALFEGIEKEGVMKIATIIAKRINEVHNRTISLQDAKDVIDTGIYKLRNEKHDYKDFVDEVKKTYLKELLALIEQKYGKIIDKCDFISVTGGGSAIFKSTQDGFIRIPETAHEYYNSIGFAIFGLSKI